MTLTQIQTGTHYGKQVIVYDVTAGLETVLTIRFEYQEKDKQLVDEFIKAIKSKVDANHTKEIPNRQPHPSTRNR